jgi:hypothetical protein
MGDGADQPLLMRSDLSQLDWAALEPLAERYDVTGIVIANASADGNSAQLTEWTESGRQIESLAFAHSTFAATAEASAMKIAEGWKNRAAIDYSLRGRITADIQFESPDEWSKIRNQLNAVKSVSGMDVVGVSLHEAQVELSYYGRAEQLKDAMSQQDLDLTGEGAMYTLALADTSGAGSP